MLWALSLLMVNGSWLLFNLPRRSAMPLGLSKNLWRFGVYPPTHDVVPSAVTMAVATDAMICTINLNVLY